MKNTQVANIKTTMAFNPAYCIEILISKTPPSPAQGDKRCEFRGRHPQLYSGTAYVVPTINAPDKLVICMLACDTMSHSLSVLKWLSGVPGMFLRTLRRRAAVALMTGVRSPADDVPNRV